MQLLVDDEDLARVKTLTKTLSLKEDNKIAFPHVSFLTIADEDEGIQNDFASFVNKIDLNLKAAQGHLKFFAQGVKDYDAEQTGVKYWCLEDADKTGNTKPNEANIKLAAKLLITSMEQFINTKKPSQENKKPAFTKKTPGQVVEAVSQQTEKMQQSYVEYTKGFPHMSVAKGKNIDSSQFSEATKEPFALKIKGYKIIYNYSNDPKEFLPQIFITKMFNDPNFNLYSEFKCLKDGFHGDYINIGLLMDTIGGINSVYVKKEILEIRKIRTMNEMQKLIKNEEKQSPLLVKRKFNEMNPNDNNNTTSQTSFESEKTQLLKRIEELEKAKKQKI